MSTTIGNNLKSQFVQGNALVSNTPSPSVYGTKGVDNNGGVGNTSTTVTSKIDKLLSQIADKFENLSVDELKEFLKQANFDVQKLLTMPEDELQRRIAFIENIIKNCAAEDGKNIDKEKLAQKAQDMAEMKAEIEKHGLTGIIKQYLPDEYKNIQSLTEIKDKSVIVNAVKEFINQRVKTELKALKTADNDTKTRARAKTKAMLEQLLDSTAPQDKIVIFGAFMELVKEDKEIVQFLGMTLDNMSVEERQKFISDFINEKFLAKIQVLGISGEAVNEIVAKVSKNANGKNLPELLQQIETLVETVGANREQISTIIVKIQKASEELGRAPEKDELQNILAPEELSVYETFQQQIGMLAGFGEGVSQNEIVDSKTRIEMLGQWNNTLQQYNVQQEVFNEIKKYTETHKNDENVSIEKVINTLNKATEGQFADKTGLNTAADVLGSAESKTSVASSGLGFSVKSEPEIVIKQKKVEKEQPIAKAVSEPRQTGTSVDGIYYDSLITTDKPVLTLKQAIADTKSFKRYISENAGNLIEAFNHFGALRGNKEEALKRLTESSFDVKVNTMHASSDAAQKAALEYEAITLNDTMASVINKNVLEKFKEDHV